MGCGGSRKQVLEARPDQKWDYISLNDFKSTSCFTPLAYGYLWFSLLLSVAVYSVDTFTAVNLLVFNQSSNIVPTQTYVSKDVSKWIFSICIILSFINLGYEHIRAMRTMRRGNVADCFMDNLAVRLESIRLGKGRGWKRFLVFASLTKSQKGAEYVALFTYFSFQSWFRVIICSGPRQAINALTLLSVYNAQIDAKGNNFESSLMDFFRKIGLLATKDNKLAIILSGMCFTLVVWVFSFLSLCLAVCFFVFFLWGHIPKSDRGLTGYCSRLVNNKLMKIVTKKVNKAIAEEERKRKKAELKMAKKTGEVPLGEMQATIPDVGGDKLPSMPTLQRNDTMSTLPLYSSRPGTPGDFELGTLDQKRPMPSRTGTMASTSSNFSARAPLLGGAAAPGYDARIASPAPSLPGMPDPSRYGLNRTGTMGSQSSYASRPGGPPGPNRMNTSTPGSEFGGPIRPGGQFGPNRAMTSTPGSDFGGSVRPGGPLGPSRAMTSTPGSDFGGQGRPVGPSRMNTATPGSDFGAPYTQTPSTYSSETMPSLPAMPQPMRPTMGAGGFNREPAPSHRQDSSLSSSRGPFDDFSTGRNSPAPSMNSYRGTPVSPRGMMSPAGPGPAYPMRSATNPVPPRGPGFPAPQRNMTAPYQQQEQGGGYDYFDRPSTANSQRGPGPRPGFGNGWQADLESQRGTPGPRY